ncbi:hypothetical protein BT63DRAFT_410201 [Microthyrium microscopicum]|uniref:Mis12-domain-containing protein n=1 Tax=Microthyrium microscopicum TaxID=703497 RepID=A0A6A6UNY7_9PEZI|nr:hypothetical protein BT63DRAFT_410201 [Microthyrium microscopicum]
MATTSAKTALLTEHLEYTPLALIDEIIDTVNDLSNRAIDAAEKGVLAANPSDIGFAEKARAEKRAIEKDENNKPVFADAEGELRDGINKLETLLQTNIDRNFDKFEIVAFRSIIQIPDDLVPWLRLAHYENIPQHSTPQSLKPEDISLLRQKLRETKKLRSALRDTIARNNAIISSLKSLTSLGIDGHSQPGPFAFLTSGAASEHLHVGSVVEHRPTSAGPLETNLSFAISQLPALRELLADLRPQLSQLATTTDQAASESETARQRRAYVEAQSKRAVERQGLATDNGALDALGRVVTVDELASLEALAAEQQNADDEDVEMR